MFHWNKVKNCNGKTSTCYIYEQDMERQECYHKIEDQASCYPMFSNYNICVWNLVYQCCRSKKSFWEVVLGKLLHVHPLNKRTNERILLKIGEKNRLFNAIVKQKLQYFGHIARREGFNLEKLIMFGIVQGKRSIGRQKLRWIDGIASLTKELGVNI